MNICSGFAGFFLLEKEVQVSPQSVILGHKMSECYFWIVIHVCISLGDHLVVLLNKVFN
jgi:hypothetical protein